MRFLVTGALGQLGRAVCDEVVKRKQICIATDIIGPVDDLACDEYICVDVTDNQAVFRLFYEKMFDVVIHCAAYTNVNDAEKPDNAALVRAVNSEATGYLAEAASKYDVLMIYISTDYVFGKDDNDPIMANDNRFNPLNHYGSTKLQGENKVRKYCEKYFIVRTSCVFGAHGANFFDTILKAATKYEELRVVNDQIGGAAYTRDLAALLVDMAVSDRYGTYHAINEGGFYSRCELAKLILELSGSDTKVIPVSTAEYDKSGVTRPFNSRLDTSLLSVNGFTPLPDIKDALKRYLIEREALLSI